MTELLQCKLNKNCQKLIGNNVHLLRATIDKKTRHMYSKLVMHLNHAGHATIYT